MNPTGPRFSLTGPDIALPGDASLALSLIIHELSTNAAKYGALRHDQGHVKVEWNEEGREVALSWIEIDGPPVDPPGGQGFGSLLIKRAFSQAFDPHTSFAFQPNGLKFSLRFKLPN